MNLYKRVAASADFDLDAKLILVESAFFLEGTAMTGTIGRWAVLLLSLAILYSGIVIGLDLTARSGLIEDCQDTIGFANC